MKHKRTINIEGRTTPQIKNCWRILSSIWIFGFSLTTTLDKEDNK